MSTAGYSGTELLKKLGIKKDMKVLVINPPGDYLKLFSEDISSQLVRSAPADLVHLFVKSNKEFEREMKQILLLAKANRNIILWISWYKKSSGIGSDISENMIREYALKNELVDIKVCAVSDLWSGLKLVVPKAKR